jgi:hypothetical protein
MMPAFIMRNASTTFDTSEYKQELTKAELVPDAPVEQLRTLDPTVIYSDVDSSTWTFDIAGVQNWVVSQGLADFLNDNHGGTVEVVLQPRPGAGQRIATFNVICMSPNFGGEQGSWALMELSLPVDGVPVFSVSV